MCARFNLKRMHICDTHFSQSLFFCGVKKEIWHEFRQIHGFPIVTEENSTHSPLHRAKGFINDYIKAVQWQLLFSTKIWKWNFILGIVKMNRLWADGHNRIHTLAEPQSQLSYLSIWLCINSNGIKRFAFILLIYFSQTIFQHRVHSPISRLRFCWKVIIVRLLLLPSSWIFLKQKQETFSVWHKDYCTLINGDLIQFRDLLWPGHTLAHNSCLLKRH